MDIHLDRTLLEYFSQGSKLKEIKKKEDKSDLLPKKVKLSKSGKAKTKGKKNKQSKGSLTKIKAPKKKAKSRSVRAIYTGMTQ